MKEGLSIILPAFNEGKNLEKVIHDTIVFIRQYIEHFEVIIVNDGSRDNTLSVLSHIEATHPELRVVSHNSNKGYGEALKTGIDFIDKKWKWVFFMDADNQFNINDFREFWDRRDAYDFILGYRKSREDNLYRILLAKFGNFVSNLLLKERIKDINCGFKLFKTKDLKTIFLKSKGGTISFEILWHLLKKKKKFAELPVGHYRRKIGKAMGGNIKTVLKIISEGINLVLSNNKNDKERGCGKDR